MRSRPIATTTPIIQPIGPFPDVGAELAVEAGVTADATGAEAGTDAATGAEAAAISLAPDAG
jgi:hypothetical protein